MPWFVVDDSAHSHPKIVKAGNAAMGLWLRCGSYCAQHTTDGIVPGQVASMYGTAPQAAKLVKLGLWHQAGHDCPRCPQPPEGDYVMHDYHDYNPTRQQVEERRAKAAEKKRRQRAGGKPQPPNPGRNRGGFADDSSANRERIENESSPIHRPVSEEIAGHSDVSPGDSPVTRARAFPSPPIPSIEQVVDVGGESAGSSGPAGQRPDGLPPAPIDLDGFTLTDPMRRWAHATYPGLDVDYETAQFIDHHRADGTRRRNWPEEWKKWMRRSAKWASERALRTASGNVIPLTATRRPSTTDARVAQALEVGERLQAMADAARATRTNQE